MASRRIILVVTSIGRILFVDAVSQQQKDGNHEVLRTLEDASNIRVKFKGDMFTALNRNANSEKRFKIVNLADGNSRTMNFTELAGTSNRWKALRELYMNNSFPSMEPEDIVQFNLGLGDENMPLDRVGFIGKLPFNRQVLHEQNTADSEERTRFFILQGGSFRYYKHEVDEFPKGQIYLCGDARESYGDKNIQISIDRLESNDRNKFRLVSKDYPSGLVMVAKSPQEMSIWKDDLIRISKLAGDGQFERYKRMNIPEKYYE